jgi:hypothetical protein
VGLFEFVILVIVVLILAIIAIDYFAPAAGTNPNSGRLILLLKGLCVVLAIIVILDKAGILH